MKYVFLVSVFFFIVAFCSDLQVLGSLDPNSGLEKVESKEKHLSPEESLKVNAEVSLFRQLAKALGLNIRNSPHTGANNENSEHGNAPVDEKSKDTKAPNKDTTTTAKEQDLDAADVVERMPWHRLLIAITVIACIVLLVAMVLVMLCTGGCCCCE